MPREPIVLGGFEGGMTDDPSRVELNDNELYVAKDLDLSKYGIVKVLTKYSAISSPDWASKISIVKTVEPGYGLYSFSADYDVNSSPVSTDYIVIAGKTTDNNKVVQVFDSSGNVLPTTGGSSSITIATGDTTPFYPSFFYIDGALRICDGNLNSTKSSNYKLMYLKNIQFNDSNRETEISKWVYREITFPEPTAGIVYNGMTVSGGTTNTITMNASDLSYLSTTLLNTHYYIGIVTGSSGIHTSRKIISFASPTLTIQAATAAFTADAGAIFPPAGNINLDILTYSSTQVDQGTFPAGDYKFGISYRYENFQESKVRTLSGKISLTTGTGPYLMLVRPRITLPLDNRIFAANLYARFTTDEDSGWQRIGMIDMKYGLVNNELSPLPEAGDIESFNPGLYTGTVTGTSNTPSDVYISAQKYYKYFEGETYASISGRIERAEDITSRYRTVVISNRSAYYGNVKIDSQIFGDTILKSRPNRFDQVTIGDRIDVLLNDGDEIVRLESFEDRILQFKKRKLYIINTAQDIEFLEAQLDYRGISLWHHVVKTDYGIFWFNDYGVYMYDGRTVIDLFMDATNPRRRKVSLTNWQSFLGDNPSITYDRVSKRVNIANKLSGTGQINIYSFDLNTFTWSVGYQSLGTTSVSKLHTNFITDSGFKSITLDGSDLTMYEWSTSGSASTGFAMETKAFDLDNHGTKKILYGVYIKHKGSTGNVSVKYKTNGTSDIYSFSTSFLPSATTYTITRFAPLYTSESHNWKTVSLYITSTNANSNLEIDDISMIVRRKGLR